MRERGEGGEMEIIWRQVFIQVNIVMIYCLINYVYVLNVCGRSCMQHENAYCNLTKLISSSFQFKVLHNSSPLRYIQEHF